MGIKVSAQVYLCVISVVAYARYSASAAAVNGFVGGTRHGDVVLWAKCRCSKTNL